MSLGVGTRGLRDAASVIGLSGHGSMINGNALSWRATLGRPPGFQDHGAREAVCVQDAVSEWPSVARRRFHGGYHGV